MGEHVRAGELDIWTEQAGEGSDVLLIGGGSAFQQALDVLELDRDAGPGEHGRGGRPTRAPLTMAYA